MAAGSLRLDVVAAEGDDVYWLERRPAEQGRYVLVRRRGGESGDVTPPGTNVRTRVHEYGGGACLVSSGGIYYSEFSDQRLYRLEAGGVPRAITSLDSARGRPWSYAYADAALHPSSPWLFCVREDHSAPGEPVTTIVRIDVDGPMTTGEAVVSGHDFYSTPRVSPDGSRLCWLAWRHPQMPWDGTELWVARIDADGRLSGERLVGGGAEESIVQPGWSPDGALYFVSDWTGWWNLYRESSTIHEAVCPLNADFARPQWVFGMSTWAFAGPERLVVTYHDVDGWHVATLDATFDTNLDATLDARQGGLTPLPIGLQPGQTIVATSTHAVFVGSSPRAPDAVVRVSLDSPEIEILREGSGPMSDGRFVSEARAIEFPTDEGQTAHAFFYAPVNPDVEGPEGERPPLMVVSHGGPTSAAESSLNLEIQYWTTRGFAVVDVDYGGSSGYGRAYRQRLNGRWGEVDVADCVNAARFLVGEGRVDPARLIIRGRSAGGYTTLAALTFRPEVFAAAASHYGVSDLEVLARDTHKFESRYLDRLIGPYPAMRDVYIRRSPIHHIDRIACPLILLQGLEDRIVPPSQAQMMADAVRAKGLPVALVLFEGEQHGFRRAESIVRSLESELAFYAAVFAFTPSDALPAIPIDNLA